jgi:hypothetical protein
MGEENILISFSKNQFTGYLLKTFFNKYNGQFEFATETEILLEKGSDCLHEKISH